MVGIDTKRKVNSMLIAMFMLELQICDIISDLVVINNISIILLTFILIIFFINNRKILIGKISIISYCVICIIIVVSFILNGYQYVYDSCIYFLTFGTVAFLISATKIIDYVAILKYIIYISFIRCIFYVFFEMDNLNRLARLIDKSVDWSYDLLQMQLAFEFMQIAIAALIVIAFKEKICESKFFLTLSILTLFCSVKVILFDCWTRGAIVGVAGTMFVLLMWKRSRSGIEIFIFTVAILLILNNLELILTLVNDYLSSKSINIRALEKTIFLISQNNTTNYRTDLYASAIEIFFRNLLFGVGIGYVEKITGSVYVHNLILEIMCETGIIGTFLFGIILYKNIEIFIKKKNSDFEIFISILFLLSFFTLLTSGKFWKTPIFWIYFFMMTQKFSLLKSSKQLSILLGGKK